MACSYHSNGSLYLSNQRCLEATALWRSCCSHGSTAEYFELAEGQAIIDVLDMAHQRLPHELAALLRPAARSEKEVFRNGIRVGATGELSSVKIDTSG